MNKKKKVFNKRKSKIEKQKTQKTGVKSSNSDKIPKIKYKTAWDLSVLYKSINDPQIEKDVVKTEKLYEAFAKKYSKNKKYLSNSLALLKALKDYERLSEEATSRPLLYTFLALSLNSNEQGVRAKENLIKERLNKASNKIVFFMLNLGKIDKKLQKKFLFDKNLSKYKYLLERVFETSKYDLSEEVEKALSLTSAPRSSMWVQGVSRVKNQQTVEWKGKELPLSEVGQMILKMQPAKERYALYQKYIEKLKSVSDFAESEVNAIFTGKKISDEMRNFKKPYSATLIGNENKDQSVEALVEIVTKNFDLSQRFYKLKARLLGMSQLKYTDRSLEIGALKHQYTFDQSVDMLRRAFYKLGDLYGRFLDDMLEKGRADVYPKKGKRGGAFCLSHDREPVFVCLNHTNTAYDLRTFAHEMGHAIHAHLTKRQPIIYMGCSIAVAETASTFFENIIDEEIVADLTNDEKIIFQHSNLNGTVATIFRQIACFNFELELHNTIRTKGYLPKEEIAKLMNKHMQAYMGKAVKFTDDDGYFFVDWSHIRTFFYVYTYSYGDLISSALYQKYQEDNSYIKQIEQFLSAGCSAKPEDIFGNIGLKVDENLFKSGLKKFEKDLDDFEKLVGKRGRK